MRRLPFLSSLVLLGLLLVGCGPQTPGVTPTVSPQATPMPPDGPFPVRYYHTEMPVSLEPPIGWSVNEDVDSQALAVLTSPDGEATLLLTSEVPAFGADAADENLQAVGAWMGSGVHIEEEQDFEFNSGEVGYLRRGRAADSSTWAAATLLTDEVGFHLLYSAPQNADEATYEAFPATARSLRLEPTEPIEVDRSTTLSLDAGESPELDPALTRYGGPDGAVGDLFRGLVVLDPDLQIRPALAEDWQVSPDGSDYTFFLNPQARFHNGRPVTAEDVVFSWERAASPGPGVADGDDLYGRHRRPGRLPHRAGRFDLRCQVDRRTHRAGDPRVASTHFSQQACLPGFLDRRPVQRRLPRLGQASQRHWAVPRAAAPRGPDAAARGQSVVRTAVHRQSHPSAT